MQINMNDIAFMAGYGLNVMANQFLNEEVDTLKANSPLSEEKIRILFEKYDMKNILNSEHAANCITVMITSAISEYHDQLREKLLESGIDIGDIDCQSPSSLRDSFINLQQDNE